MARREISCALLLLGACGSDGDAADASARDAAPPKEAGTMHEAGITDAASHHPPHTDEAGAPRLGFFVSSDRRATGDLGGLVGADERCQLLAAAVGAGDRTWRAYLSTEHGGQGDGPIHARDRIGSGPWYNAAGELVAADIDALHARSGDAEVFLDELGNKVNGQWQGSPDPNEHDILTGTGPDGRVLVGATCQDWTSDAAEDVAQVGHSDGLGPGMDATPPYNAWHSVHPSAGCNDTAPRGGAGRIYCFAAD